MDVEDLVEDVEMEYYKGQLQSLQVQSEMAKETLDKRHRSIDYETRELERMKVKLNEYRDGRRKFKLQHQQMFKTCPKCQTQYDQVSGYTKDAIEEMDEAW